MHKKGGGGSTYRGTPLRGESEIHLVSLVLVKNKKNKKNEKAQLAGVAAYPVGSKRNPYYGSFMGVEVSVKRGSGASLSATPVVLIGAKDTLADDLTPQDRWDRKDRLARDGLPSFST